MVLQPPKEKESWRPDLSPLLPIWYSVYVSHLVLRIYVIKVYFRCNQGQAAGTFLSTQPASASIQHRFSCFLKSFPTLIRNTSVANSLIIGSRRTRFYTVAASEAHDSRLKGKGFRIDSRCVQDFEGSLFHGVSKVQRTRWKADETFHMQPQLNAERSSCYVSQGV
jgi:hypothetical protein